MGCCKAVVLQTLCSAALVLYSSTGSSEPIELFGRLSVSAFRTQLKLSDDESEQALLGNGQSLRIMASHGLDAGYWSVHTTLLRFENDIPYQGGLLASPGDSPRLPDALRYRSAAGTVFDRMGAGESVQVRYEIDRAFYHHDWSQTSLSFGRQAIDFGLGRLWQPLNIFGDFSPAALDTDYKTGIDAFRASQFFGAGGERRVVYVFGRHRRQDATAISGRHMLGATAQVLWLAAMLPGGAAYGAGVESEWRGWGWRIESSYGNAPANVRAGFWVIGMDRQFTEDLWFTFEWYRHSGGFSTVAAFENWQKQLRASSLSRASHERISWLDTTRQGGARDQLGFAVSKSVTPLIQANWLTLAGRLRDVAFGKYRYAFAHQFSVSVSMSDNADLLFSVFSGVGKGQGYDGALGSDYGHIPLQTRVRYRHYF